MTKKETTASSTDSANAANSDIRELAKAMNRLADSLNQTNAIIANATNEDPNWEKIPTMMLDLNRQLRLIASRL
ncbi:MAG: hypothetical protein ACNYPH_03635 [Gammaproteobacteria bacterium WSBS_2016_MAG_OTU1]